MSATVMNQAYAKLPARDVGRARAFYAADKLNLTPFGEYNSHLYYELEGSHFMVYPSGGAASGTHDQLGFVVEDIGSMVSRLRSNGVVFEEYEPPPGASATDGIMDFGGLKSAWFKDSEGNLLSVVEFAGGSPFAMEAMLDAEGEAASRTFAHEPAEGEAWWWVGMLATIKATAEQTGGRYSLVEIHAPDGYGSVLHVHHREDEGFYILEGELTFYVGEQTIKARPGSYLFGPKDVPHTFTVDSGPARLLFVLSPAGLEGLVREMGEPARSLSIPPQPDEPPDEAEMERMATIAARHGAEILGPPPGL